MATTYNNLPPTPSRYDSTIRAFDNYYDQPFELNAGTFYMMKGFFQKRGFEDSAAESVAVTIMKQAKVDGYNPLEVLDNLGAIDNVELNSVVSEILNYNRFKTSFIGYADSFRPNAEVARNIIA
jgi:hypothetical protein